MTLLSDLISAKLPSHPVKIKSAVGSSTYDFTLPQNVAGGVSVLSFDTAGTTRSATIVGTSNQVNVNATTSTFTLSLPQNIHSGANPSFTGLNLSGLSASTIVGLNGSKNAASIPYGSGSYTPSFSGTGSASVLSATYLYLNNTVILIGGADIGSSGTININAVVGTPTVGSFTRIGHLSKSAGTPTVDDCYWNGSTISLGSGALTAASRIFWTISYSV